MRLTTTNFENIFKSLCSFTVEITGSEMESGDTRDRKATFLESAGNLLQHLLLMFKAGIIYQTSLAQVITGNTRDLNSLEYASGFLMVNDRGIILQMIDAFYERRD